MPPRSINIFTHACAPLPEPIRATGPGAERYAVDVAMAGALLGMERLGCNIFVVPPGKRAFPFHNHHAAEELFVILEGTGSFRQGSDAIAIGPGDMLACPAGGPDSAHQIVNDGTQPLRYLAVSTRPDVDVIEYPDSGKTRVLAGGTGLDLLIGKDAATPDYWEGE